MKRFAATRIVERTSAKKNEPFYYWAMVGSLMCLMVATRPDIAFAVWKLSQSCKAPNCEDFVSAKRVLRYLRGTVDFGVTYDGSKVFQIEGY